jgi:hypothetical protein
MKPSNHAEPSASTHYSPSVPMSVYRELAAELRANKAVIDSLNDRNQQLIAQNQRLKQEIHNVVQATLSLGQFAGVARQTAQEGFPSAIAPDTLARLVRSETRGKTEATSPENSPLESSEAFYGEYSPVAQTAPVAPSLAPVKTPARPAASLAAPRNRVPRPIASHPTAASTATSAAKPTAAKQNPARTAQLAKPPAARKPQRLAKRTEIIPSQGVMSQGAATKLFTEQSGEYRSSVLDSQESKEIGGIWLVLSIILIIVTAFGAGFLIMKPLLNER